MDISLLIGISGATLILIAFLGLEFKKLSAQRLQYQVINFLGSTLLVVYAVLGRSYPFIILNTVWAFVSLKEIVRMYVDKIESKKSNSEAYVNTSN